MIAFGDVFMGNYIDHLISSFCELLANVLTPF